MFICRGCVKDKAEYDLRFFHSRGPCEVCGYTDMCIDAQVAIDPKWRSNLYDDLIKAGLVDEANKWKKWANNG